MGFGAGAAEIIGMEMHSDSSWDTIWLTFFLLLKYSSHHDC